MDFEQELMSFLKTKIVTDLKKESLIRVEYSDRKPLPKHIIDKLWNSVDWDNVIKTIKPEFEKRICNTIIGNMEKEIKTDVKSVLSVDGVRQKLRIEIYPKLMAILNEKDLLNE